MSRGVQLNGSGNVHEALWERWMGKMDAFDTFSEAERSLQKLVNNSKYPYAEMPKGLSLPQRQQPVALFHMLVNAQDPSRSRLWI